MSQMKIAIAGAGDVGTYFLEEFTKSQHEIVLLTRAEKRLPAASDIEQRITDYSVEDLCSKLADCDAIVSTMSGPNDVYVKIHRAILEACRRSKSCKRFIPSEWTINIKDFPDQPIYHSPQRAEFRATLREQSEVKYTLVCNGWFADYVLPADRRYLKDVGMGWPANHQTKEFDIYGPGTQLVSLTSVRDVARAALGLLDQDPLQWPEYTHLAAQTLTYVELFRILTEHDPSWTARPLPFAKVVDSLVNGVATEENHLRVLGFIGANLIPEDRRLVWGEGPLKGLQPRTVQQLLQHRELIP